MAYPRLIKGKFYCAICNQPHRAKGYCHKHYRRWKKYGDPHFKKHLYRGEMKGKTCIFCDEPAVKKWMCQLHYRRIKNTGTPYLRGSLAPYGR